MRFQRNQLYLKLIYYLATDAHRHTRTITIFLSGGPRRIKSVSPAGI